MDFIDNHPAQPRENPRCVLIRQQQGQAFRRGQQNMRRSRALTALYMGGGVAGAVLYRDRQAHFRNRRAQVAFDIGGKCLERGDIKRVQPVMCALCELGQTGQKTCKRLAPARWRHEEQ